MTKRKQIIDAIALPYNPDNPLPTFAMNAEHAQSLFGADSGLPPAGRAQSYWMTHPDKTRYQSLLDTATVCDVSISDVERWYVADRWQERYAMNVAMHEATITKSANATLHAAKQIVAERIVDIAINEKASAALKAAGMLRDITGWGSEHRQGNDGKAGSTMHIDKAIIVQTSALSDDELFERASSRQRDNIDRVLSAKSRKKVTDI